MKPDVSIVLVTHNAGSTLMDILTAIAGQAAGFRWEVVAIDSGSTDGTCERLQRSGVRVRSIPPGEFNHGLTRNLAIEESRGEFAVLLVQDAVPASDDWLAHLVTPLMQEPSLAGSYARQTPRPDASPLTRYYLKDWIATSDMPRTHRVEDLDAFKRMAPIDRYLTCVFDNVCSCVRRSVWQRIPFRHTRIAEDLEWARDVLEAGYGIAYVPESVVIHSHERSARYELMRTYLVHQRLRTLFGVATIPDLWRLSYAIATTVPVHVHQMMAGGAGRPREVARALALAIALPLGQYLGARSADTGRELLQARGI